MNILYFNQARNNEVATRSIKFGVITRRKLLDIEKKAK